MESSKQEAMDLSIYYLDMVMCPLNPTHQLRRHKLSQHLLKCRKSYPDKIQCPYGHFYYTDKDKMANHLQTCTFKPSISYTEEMQPHVQEARNAREKNIKYNYDVDNYTIDEPYWD